MAVTSTIFNQDSSIFLRLTYIYVHVCVYRHTNIYMANLSSRKILPPYALWQLCEGDHFFIPKSIIGIIILFETSQVIRFPPRCGGYCHQGLNS